MTALPIVPKVHDLGDGFQVRRALPSRVRRSVGPFVFFDQMGPAVLGAGRGLDVRPHPHIGLATVTYLFEGEILHRDSLGAVQPIRPGEVNWMTAGRGIVHSERTPPELRAVGGSRLSKPGLRTARRPHRGSDALPVIEGEGRRVRLIAGSLDGAQAPVEGFSEMVYADAVLSAGARLEISADHEERAIYIVEGRIGLTGKSSGAGKLLVLRPGTPQLIEALVASRVLLFGGEPMDGPRHLWWNFVSSSAERIEQAG